MSLKRLIVYILFLSGIAIKINAQDCYELVWNDEFNYVGLPDSTKWTYETGGDGWGNNELQYYTSGKSENTYVQDGVLTISANKESYGGRSYTSARLITYYKQGYWKYGKIEARMKLPYGQGIWPAFWMLGTNIFEGTSWPACGETDIMELVGGSNGNDSKVYGTAHWANSSSQHAQYGNEYQLSSGIFADTFHTFSIIWDEKTIKWLVDGIQYNIIDITPADLSEFHNPFFILLNLAVGGNWPGNPDATTVFPQKMVVDYVRVYQQNLSPKITGDSSIFKCQSNLTYSIQASDSNDYEWTVPSDAEIISGQGTKKISVNWGCSDSLVSCRLSSSCKTLNLQLDVKTNNQTVNGPVYVHENAEGLVYSVPVIADATYLWKVSDGITFNGRNDSNAVSINWNSVDGEIILKLKTLCGSDSITVPVSILRQLPYPEGNGNYIPGTIYPAMYDLGGEGLAYHDTDSINDGNGSRQDEGVDTEISDGIESVGNTITDEWLEYTVKVDSSKEYYAELLLASYNSIGKLSLSFNGEQRSEIISVPSTGAKTTFKSVYIKNIPIYITDTLMRVNIIIGGFNLGRIIFSDTSTATLSKENRFVFNAYYQKNGFMYVNSKCRLKYSVINLLGEKIDSGIVNQGENYIDLNDLNQAIYLVNFSSSGYSKTIKILKYN